MLTVVLSLENSARTGARRRSLSARRAEPRAGSGRFRAAAPLAEGRPDPAAWRPRGGRGRRRAARCWEPVGGEQGVALSRARTREGTACAVQHAARPCPVFGGTRRPRLGQALTSLHTYGSHSEHKTGYLLIKEDAA
jgi:hypothetical protein